MTTGAFVRLEDRDQLKASIHNYFSEWTVVVSSRTKEQPEYW